MKIPNFLYENTRLNTSTPIVQGPNYAPCYMSLLYLHFTIVCRGIIYQYESGVVQAMLKFPRPESNRIAHFSLLLLLSDLDTLQRDLLQNPTNY